MPWGIKTAAVMCVVAFACGWIVNGWRLGEEMQQERTAAAKDLSAQVAKVLKLERDAAALRKELEVAHENANKQIERTLADNRRLTRELGGMRDPGRRAAACPLPGAAGEPEDAAAGARLSGTSEGLLSDEASEFILELAADADRAAEYAKTCHEWAMRSKY